MRASVPKIWASQYVEKPSDADKAPKAAVPALLAAAPSVLAPDPIDRLEPVAVAVFRVLPSGFVRPMRR